jgi:hypothetical protein
MCAVNKERRAVREGGATVSSVKMRPMPRDCTGRLGTGLGSIRVR